MRFRDALAGPGLGAIAEIKRRSPSLGDIRPDADPAQLAHDYASAGAAAVSVLVDERFGGTWDDLRAARASTGVPLLAKGFFSTEQHLRTAKEAGADAVLLLLRDLDDDAVRSPDAARGRPRTGHARRGARRRRARASRDRRRSGHRRQRARSLHLRDRPGDAARSRRADPRRPDRNRGERHPDARPGRRGRAGRGRCDPRRLDPDAGAGPGRNAARAPAAPARQGLRAHPRGGRGRRSRGRRRPGGIRARAGEPTGSEGHPAGARRAARGRRLGR